jgi:signal transduction histidine kinase
MQADAVFYIIAGPPRRRRVLPVLAAAMLLGSTRLGEAASLLDAASQGMGSDLLVLAIVIGIILAAAGAAHLFLRAAARAKQTATQATEAMTALRQELEVAQAIVMADPQALIAFEPDGTARLVNHGLDPKIGVPPKLRNLMRFASWLERGAAVQVETRLKELKANGRSFELTLKTLAGPDVEVEGRASAGGYYLKIRDLADRRMEFASLLRQHRGLSEELASQRALLDALPLPVWFRDAEGKLQWVNRAYMSAVEAARSDEVIEQQRELLENRQRRAAETALASGETFRRRLQTVVAGERRSYDTIVVPVGAASAGAVIDIAPLESAQDELSRHMAAHERTLDRVATAVAIYGSDQKMAFHNQAFRDLWGLDNMWLDTRPKLSEVFDQLRQRRLLPEQADYRTWRDSQVKAFEHTESIEEWWHLPDGRTVHVLADRRPDGGIAYLFDEATERLALESRYNALINVQRETLDNLREGVAVFGSDGRLKLFNPAFAGIWQLSAEVLEIGPHIDEVWNACKHLLTNGDPWQTAHSAVTGVFEHRDAFDGTVARPDGMTLAYAGVPLPDGGMLLTYIDISDSKRVEMALIERNEALEAADKLKNTFLSHISYELRTPLTNIIGFSDLLAEPPIGPLYGKQREYLEDIRTSSSKLLAIINDILDLATIDAGALELKLAPVPVREIAEAARLGIRDRLAKSGVTLDIQVAPDLDQIVADRQRLTQVLFHLLSNAIGFSPEGSVITLSCRREEEGMAAFAVQDSGVGIPEEYQASVFGRFESRSQGSKHRGTGLGLAIVKSLVELHGGQIKLRSAPGVGTTVTVLIPDGLGRVSHDSGSNGAAPEIDGTMSAEIAAQPASGGAERTAHYN